MSTALSLRRPRAGFGRSSRHRLAAPAAAWCRPVSGTPAVKGKGEGHNSQTLAYNDMLYGNNPLRLPRLPIPKLEDTVSRYLQVRALYMYKLRAFHLAPAAAFVFCSAASPLVVAETGTLEQG